MAQANNQFLKLLADAPDRQLDKSMADYAKTLIGKSEEEVRDGLKHMLDQSANGGLASHFTMILMDAEWKRLGGKL
jgi:hypothetical protein